ncbi:MAG: glycerol kinase GlpK [Candidatus Omnitrophica bacterium]|nr:glycerol kinase GlpK [Candidatus Omnitrophota bacterium]
MAKKYILSIDQGTTGSRAFIFDDHGQPVASDYQEFRQYFPKPGWVEHDADEIWKSCCSVIKGVLRKSRINKKQIAGIGITNQRETTVLWDRKTSKPVGKAIVWQCRRTADICAQKKYKNKEALIKKKTGLVLDPYFSGTKIKWLLDNTKGLRARALRGDVCFGTIDSWLIWKLTAGESHVTDMTNASRTLIFNIRERNWDKELLKLFDIPQKILPSVQNSGSIFGHAKSKDTGLPVGIPIAAVLGDQQAALYGQGCFDPGTVKNTYGTGCFIVLNTGKKLMTSRGGLLSTIASDADGHPVYALEGSVFIAGAVVQWLRDQLRVIKKSSDSERLIQGVRDTNGVYFVPAFAGLGAPYWDSHARGVITGLTRGANCQHITRAALESIAYQVKDVFDLMKKESRKNISILKVDGGACANEFLMQFQADILSCQIKRPVNVDSTAFGVALLAGRKVNVFKTKVQLMKAVKTDKVFKPKMKKAQRDQLYQGWVQAVKKARIQ